MGHLLQDLRYATRMLKRSRAVTLTAILTLAVGIGANTAIFSVVNAVLLRPLPYADADRLALIFENARRPTGTERRSVAYPTYKDWQRSARSFTAMAATSDDSVTVSSGATPERVPGEFVSGRYFEVLGTPAAVGRVLTEADDAGENGDVVVISDGFWTRRLGRRPTVIGESIRVNGRTCVIVGVMPSRFVGVQDTSEVWLPLEPFNRSALASRGTRWHAVVARLQPGVTAEQANAEMVAIAAQIERDHPDSNHDRGAEIAGLRAEMVGDLREALWVLFGAVGCVLLIACANIANLLLARGSARQKEMAIRAALGAGRGRIVRQLLTESVLLAVAGGGLGVLVAFWSVDALVSLNPVSLPRFAVVTLDPLVLIVSAAIAIATGFAFGLAPALSLSSSALHDSVKQAGHTALTDPRGDRTRRLLVIAEVALSLVLLIGASLLLRTLRELITINPGFAAEGLLTLRVDLPSPRYDGKKALVFAQTITDTLRGLPGVTAATVASDVPLAGIASAVVVELETRSSDKPVGVRVYVHRVSPGFLPAIGAPLVRGRDFTADDDDHGQREGVAIVSQRLARRHWSEGDAIGKRLKLGENTYAVVGVVGDVQHRSLTEKGTADPDIYLAFAQVPSLGFALAVRASEEQSGIVAAVRSEIERLDGSVPVFRVAWGRELLESQTAESRFSAVLLGIFAATALLLSLIGIYGVLSFLVSRETRQIGIRIALGASGRDITRLVVRRAVAPIAIGVVVGLAGAFGLSRVLGTLLYGVTATDPLTFSAAPIALTVIALLACYGPARRATKIDPIVALRTE